MARSGDRNFRPNVRPVIRAELSDKNRTLRWILIIGFLTIALICVVVGMRAVLVTEPGWELVESATTEVNTSADFVFNYCYGQTQEDPSTEKKRLTLLYSDLSVDAYRIFTQEMEKVNSAVDQPVTVDPALYEALSLLQQYGNRHLYLAPVYGEYRPIFLSSTEDEAAGFDPERNEELSAYLQELASYANDPSMIDLQLLENNQVRLMMSDAYAAYAAENEITSFVDLGWMTNAFVVDYLAEQLTEAGFTNGFLSSYDGYTRNLDSRGEVFSLNLFDRQGTGVYLPGTMQYDDPIAIVFLRDFPMSQRDSYSYYAFTDGSIVTTMIDPADGKSKSAVTSLTSYSYSHGCAQILLQQAPVFLSDSLDRAALTRLQSKGISSLWFEGTVLYCNDRDMRVTLDEKSGVAYTLEYVI